VKTRVVNADEADEPQRTIVVRYAARVDGFEGLAAAILCAIVALVVIPGVLGALIGRAFAKESRVAGAVIGGVVGVLLGSIAVGFTFFETTMRPPPRLTLEAPTGFAHEWVFLVGDPAVSREVVWEGSWTPEARVSVPRGGVVRVRSLGRLDGDLVSVSMNGRDNTSFGACNVPSLGAGRVVMYGFAPWPGTEPEPDCSDPAAFEARVRALEAE
jgi:hypothetical protein